MLAGKDLCLALIRGFPCGTASDLLTNASWRRRDTSMFFVCWWYSSCTHADQAKRQLVRLLGGGWSGTGPDLGLGGPQAERLAWDGKFWE